MCGLCGVLGNEGHWTDAPASRSLVRDRPAARERLQRVRLVNAVLAQFGLVLSDWQGAKYLLSSRTGRTEVVDNLAQFGWRRNASSGELAIRSISRWSHAWSRSNRWVERQCRSRQRPSRST